MKRAILAVFLILAWAAPICLGYGPVGHQMVGAIADQRLAGTPTGEKIRRLLDGITLERASTIPDEIKGWDKKGPDESRSPHYPDHPEIDRQLVEFWKANQPTHDMNSPNPSHHWFHYTDVPIGRGEKYADGKAGRSKWDVVQMIPYCVNVLRGKIPADNERKITPAIAVILLSHYAGDIHQPLHVGAEFFHPGGHRVAPDKEPAALGNEGGNTILLRLVGDPPTGRLPHDKKLHGFWDGDTVMALLPQVPETMVREQRYMIIDPAKKTLVQKMASEEPKSWKLSANLALENYAEAWANEILPLANEAHARLQMKNVKPLQQKDRVVAQGEAEEKPGAAVSYKDWSAQHVRGLLHKAGWRLAELLEKALAETDMKASPGSAAPVVSPSGSAPPPVTPAPADAEELPGASPKTIESESAGAKAGASPEKSSFFPSFDESAESTATPATVVAPDTSASASPGGTPGLMPKINIQVPMPMAPPLGSSPAPAATPE